jgi:hypothetical protein
MVKARAKVRVKANAPATELAPTAMIVRENAKVKVPEKVVYSADLDMIPMS